VATGPNPTAGRIASSRPCVQSIAQDFATKSAGLTTVAQARRKGTTSPFWGRPSERPRKFKKPLQEWDTDDLNDLNRNFGELPQILLVRCVTLGVAGGATGVRHGWRVLFTALGKSILGRSGRSGRSVMWYHTCKKRAAQDEVSSSCSRSLLDQ
jgi:hypothetical protein